MTLDINVFVVICLFVIIGCVFALVFEYESYILALLLVSMISSFVVLCMGTVQLDDAIANGAYDNIYDIKVSDTSEISDKFIEGEINTPGSNIILYGNKNCVIRYKTKVKTTFGPLKIKTNSTSYIKITTDKSDNILDLDSLASSFGKQLKVLEECGLDKNIYTSEDIKWIDRDGNINILSGIRLSDKEEQDTNMESANIESNNLIIELQAIKLENMALKEANESLKDDIHNKDNEISELNTKLIKEEKRSEYWKASKIDSIDYISILISVVCLIVAYTVCKVIKYRIDKNKAIYLSEIKIR